MSRTDLRVRARFAAYRDPLTDELVCSVCAEFLFGWTNVWRALHGLPTDPMVRSVPVGRILATEPLAACHECSKSFWKLLPSP